MTKVIVHSGQQHSRRTVKALTGAAPVELFNSTGPERLVRKFANKRTAVRRTWERLCEVGWPVPRQPASGAGSRPRRDARARGAAELADFVIEALERGVIEVEKVAEDLGVTVREVRSAIDRLRRKGRRIVNTGRCGFGLG